MKDQIKMYIFLFCLLLTYLTLPAILGLIASWPRLFAMKTKPIKWLTPAEIRAAADSGDDRIILACVQKHWYQLSTATARQLKWAYKNTKAGISTSFCAMCRNWFEDEELYCPNCLLVRLTNKGCYDLGWTDANIWFERWRRTPTKANFAAWQKASGKFYKTLMGIKIPEKK